MNKFKEHIQEIKFNYGVMKRCDKDSWGLFSIAPSSDPTYVWFIKKDKENFLNIPLWTDRFRDEIIYIPFDECLQLAIDHDIFVANSEQF